MKRFLFAIVIFTAIAVLALATGDAAQAQQTKSDKVKLIKGFSQDDSAWAKVEEKKRDQPDKVFGEMELESASGETVRIIFTNPCTTVCIGSRCYQKCVP